MKTTIKATNLELTPSLKTHIQSKLSSIEKLIRRFDFEGGVLLRLEVARTTQHHHKGDVFMAEINLRLPGKTLRVVEKNYDIRTAIDIARRILQQEIEKYKTRALSRKVELKNK